MGGRRRGLCGLKMKRVVLAPRCPREAQPFFKVPGRDRLTAGCSCCSILNLNPLFQLYGCALVEMSIAGQCEIVISSSRVERVVIVVKLSCM